MPQKYFNSMKTKLDFLGVAYIDREVITEKIGRKDIKGKELTRNVVASEARKIAFRSDDYNLDSKSRFSDIVAEIPLDSKEFIKAMQDAIMAEHSKSGKTVEESAKEQKLAEEKRQEELEKAEKENRKAKKLDTLLGHIADFVKDNKTNMDVIKPIIVKTKELGFANPLQIDNIKDAETIISMFE